MPIPTASPLLPRARSFRHAAKRTHDLRIPSGNRLEALFGDRHRQHSSRINDQGRICCEWRAGAAWNVVVVDYHKG